MPQPNVYLPGREAAPAPLERYLPPLPAGVVAAWLQANIPKGAWVLDPFGSVPYLATEAARAGYRVAVAAGNPIARFLFDLHARPPRADELRSALAELAASRRGDERLEPAILELYRTQCPKCGAQTPAEAFIWEREADAPHAKLVNCKACGEHGEYPTDDEDRQRAAAYQRSGPHLSLALQRIAPTGDPDREHAEEALEAYLPRAVYALFTIINRVDGLQLTDERRRLVYALLLSACDRATSLWAHPSGRLRPKQLSAPGLFREYNIWNEMERSIDLWAQNESAVPLVTWPELPPPGGITLFEGRFRELASALEGARFQAVVSAFPRPNQAFWTLCALWAGWLWGREAIGPFALVLRRKRYDWGWHTEALHAALAALSEHLAPETPFFGVVTEAEPGFNAAVVTAANLAEFRLEGMALRREEEQLQLLWRKGLEKTAAKAAPEPAVAVRRAARALLNAFGEPAHFVHMHTAGLSELSKRARMGGEKNDPGDLFAETRQQFEVALTFRGSFLRFGASEQSLETGLWWLLDSAEARTPLADRVEIAVVRYLLRGEAHALREIDETICRVFPGLLTPSRSLILACLQSYGEGDNGHWRIAPSEQPGSRRKDLREIRAALGSLGQRLGYSVAGEDAVIWREADGKQAVSFYPIASSVLGDLLLKAETPPSQSVVVVPGRRAALALYKIERDPRLRQAIEDGWRFIKFRHVRRLAENLSLTRESFTDLLELDPLTLEQAQAPLL
ncbi:MAG: hypothetical protein WEA61_01060 [Anaerolineales bacterium]